MRGLWILPLLVGCSLANLPQEGSGPPAPKPLRVRPWLGTNLTGVADWSTEWAFVDAFKASRPWTSLDTVSGQWDDGRPVATDEHGWVTSLLPNQAVITLLFWDLGGAERYPSGEYTVSYEGDGDFTYFNTTRKSGSPGKDVLQVNSAHNGFGIRITRTNPANPLRNFRVLMPGGACENQPARYCGVDGFRCDTGVRCVPFTEHTPRFHPLFLDRIQKYGALRFMDWMSTNHSAQKDWAHRPKPTDARWTVKGVPLEVMLELANHLEADPWFTLPHLATDDYVRQFARMVRDGLTPGLKVYVEHSNEVWNAIMGQANYALQQGRALGLSSNDFEAQLRYHAKRSVEMFRIWGEELGRPQDLVRVMGSFSVSPWVSDTLMQFPGAQETTDALAVAPYFGHELGDPHHAVYTPDFLKNTSPSALVEDIRTRLLPKILDDIQAQANLARSYGVDLIAYEGGQHLAGVNGRQDDDSLNAVFDAVNRAPEMKALYLEYLEGWRRRGGGRFLHFVNCSGYNKWGRWGALEFLLQPRSLAPKYDALASILDAL